MLPSATGETPTKRRRDDDDYTGRAESLIPSLVGRYRDATFETDDDPPIEVFDAPLSPMRTITAAPSVAAAAGTNGVPIDVGDNNNNAATNNNNNATQPPPARRTKTAPFSMTSLPDSIRSLASDFERRFAKLKSEMQRKQKALTKLQDATYVPKSTNLKFSFKVSKAIKDTDEFANLDSETQTLIRNFQSSMRSKLYNCVGLEQNHLQISSAKLFFNSALAIAKLLLLNQDHRNPTADIDSRFLVLLMLERHAIKLSKYQSWHPGHVFESFHAHVDDKNPAHIRGTLPNNFADGKKALADNLAQVLIFTFITSWEKKQAVIDAKEKNNILEQARRAILVEESTASTAAALDLEDTIDSKTINNLIEEKVSHTTKHLRSQIAQLEQKLQRTSASAPTGAKKAPGAGSAKNSSRGARNSASTKKKINTQPSKSNKAASAAAADNDSSAARKPKKKPTSTKQGKPNKQQNPRTVRFSKSTSK
jgi:hypothetical protein